jgi:hypothetical protein
MHRARFGFCATELLWSRAVQNRFLRPLVSVLLPAVVALLPFGASAADLQLSPIPDMYVGAWWHHGMNFTITKVSDFPEDGFAIAQWRTYTWCQDAFSHTTNPPPCDMTIGNMIEDGGIASIALVHVQGQDDRYLSGTIVATSDPDGGFGKWGGDVELTMLPGNMLLVTTSTGSVMFCGEHTDFSQYPTAPCGA